MIKVSNFLPLLLLASCTLGPDYERPLFWSDDELKNSLETMDDNNYQDKNWFYIFGDEELNLLIEKAKQNNLNVKAAISKLRQARYSLDIGKVKYWPMIDVGGEYNYKYATAYGELGNKNSFYNFGFDASWEIDIWGEGRRYTESLSALYESTAANLDNVLLLITTEVANNYFGLITAHNQLQIAKKNLRVQNDILKVVKDKYKNGLVEDGDLDQARFAVESTRAMIPDLEQAVNVYENAISILMGKLPNKNLIKIYEKNIARGAFTYDIKKLKQFPVSVVRSRPDVREAEKILKSKNAEIGAAIAAMFPNISLSSALGRQAHKFDELNYSKYAAYGYTPAISMPFLHWGQLLNEVEMSKEAKNEALYMYQNVMLNAVEEIKNAMSAVEREYEKNRALKNAAANMKKVLAAMRIKYKEGLIEFSDLLASEQNLLTAENKLAESDGQVYKNIISFYKAIGGGYY